MVHYINSTQSLLYDGNITMVIYIYIYVCDNSNSNTCIVILIVHSNHIYVYIYMIDIVDIVDSDTVDGRNPAPLSKVYT